MGTRGAGHATIAWGGAAWLVAVCGHPALAACQFTPQGEGRVSTVIDARTFRLDDGREIRLTGIEPAPTGDKATGVQALAALIDGREVTLHGTDDRPDRYGRQPAFVFLKSSDVAIQTELLARGEALVSATLTDKPCAVEMAAAEHRARLAKSGFWGDPAAIKNSESPGDILTRIGLFSVVEGRILSARQAGATFYINFGRQWTRDFAVTISRRMMPSFEAAGIDLKALRNQRIRVRGWVEKRGGPRIEATHPGQIELIVAAEDVAKRILPKNTVSKDTVSKNEGD